MNIKRLIGKLHLWLGLVSGLLMFLISISGALYAFRDEIFDKLHHNEQHAEKAGDHTLPLEELWAIAEETLGAEYPVNYVNTFSDPLRAWEFKAYRYNPDMVSYFNWCEYDYFVYVDPYSGKVLKLLDHKNEFFHLVKMFHWSFLLNTKYGQPIVGWTVLVFVITLISGLVLWWPFKRKSKRKSFVIQRTKKWKILNYDIHNVLGFYSIPFTLILALTGLVWAFKWFMALAYVAVNLSTQRPDTAKVVSADLSDKIMGVPYEAVYRQSIKKYPDAYSISIYKAGETEDGTIGTYVKKTKQVYYKAHLEKFDKYSGKLLSSLSFDDLNRGEKLLRMNYDIHVGAVFGLFGKVIAFFVALLAASMPVTGFFIWWYRRRGRNKIRINL